MNWFDILVICILAVAVIAVTAVVIYNKAHGKGGDCDGCEGCRHNCSSCHEGGQCHYRIPEDIQEILKKSQASKDASSGTSENRHDTQQ